MPSAVMNLSYIERVRSRFRWKEGTSCNKLVILLWDEICAGQVCNYTVSTKQNINQCKEHPSMALHATGPCCCHIAYIYPKEIDTDGRCWFTQGMVMTCTAMFNMVCFNSIIKCYMACGRSLMNHQDKLLLKGRVLKSAIQQCQAIIS